MDGTYKFGIIGLGVMGQSLALNIERNGYSVSGYDADTSRIESLRKRFENKRINVARSLLELISSLERPRKILMMVPAGAPVDSLIKELKPFLEKDDILIDGGNSFFKDTERRINELESEGLRFIGAGISGGEEGALKGPCIMPGGSVEGYQLIEPILTKISAKVNGEPCCTYIGAGGAGHFVKMVHNAIEYGDMQIICEAYDILKNIAGMSAQEMKNVFARWNDGALNSYLMEITADILGKIDPQTDKPLVDVILDTAGQKGTGKWSAQIALDIGVAVPTLTAAVEARILSSLKKERVEASEKLTGPEPPEKVEKNNLINNLEKALLLSKVICYTQGLSLIKKASVEFGYNVKCDEIAKIWRGGCIIRAAILNKISTAFNKKPDLQNLLLDPDFAKIAEDSHNGLRYAVSVASEFGNPAPAFYSSLNYYDSYRRERLSANLLQAQRDYFGAHTYKRIDREGTFHTEWK